MRLVAADVVADYSVADVVAVVVVVVAAADVVAVAGIAGSADVVAVAVAQLPHVSAGCMAVAATTLGQI